jgi:hypothetical protein
MVRLISFVLILTFASVSTNLYAQNCPPSKLYGNVWVHSHEEDTDTVKVYRPSTFQFPLSRGRDKFEIKKDGTILIYSVGSSDRLNQIAAHWKRINKFTIKVTPNKPELSPFTLRIISCVEAKITIQK